MVDSNVMNQIMREVLDLHNDVDEMTTDLAFRKEFANKLDSANQSYVKLFERMLAETLLLQRTKFKSQTLYQ